MKKRIFVMVLAMSVMLSLAMFASCNGYENGYEDLGEMITVVANVTVRGDDGYVLVDDFAVTLNDYASNITVLAVTREALREAGVDYGLDGLSFAFIGNYAVAQDYRIDDYEDEDEDEDYDDEYYGEEAEAFVDLIWLPTLNGSEVGGSALVSDGATIIWTFAPSGW